MDNEKPRSQYEIAVAFREACLKSILRRVEEAEGNLVHGSTLFQRVGEDVAETGIVYRYEAFESHIQLLLDSRCIRITSAGEVVLADGVAA